MKLTKLSFLILISYQQGGIQKIELIKLASKEANKNK